MSVLAKLVKQPLTLYVTSSCPFCNNARKLIAANKVESKINVLDDLPDGGASLRRELINETGQRTVPYVFSYGKLIGGFSELKQQPQAFWEQLPKNKI